MARKKNDKSLIDTNLQMPNENQLNYTYSEKLVN